MQLERVPTICLAMIVKNEGHVITRCLESVKPYIDQWVICDTGSTDETRAVVRAALEGIPGGVVDHEWRDFGSNRTRCLELAAQTGCDYMLVIDADETLQVEDPTALLTLTGDAYRIIMRFPGVSYPRINLMRTNRQWRYVGVIHEYPTATPPAEEALLEGVTMWTDGQGARGKSADKNARDLGVLKAAARSEPTNPRYAFYLASAYEIAGEPNKAALWYLKRAGMGDYYEEVYYSHLRRGQIAVLQNQWDAAVVSYLAAYGCDPTRAEPLYWLAVGYINRGQDRMALIFLEAVCLLSQPTGALFVEDQVYQILRWIQYAVTLQNLGQHDDAAVMARKCLKSGKVPAAYVEALEGIAGVPVAQEA